MQEKFKCAYCGKEYGTIRERANCELACEESRREKEEEIKRREYETNCKNSEHEITELVSLLNEKIKIHNMSYIDNKFNLYKVFPLNSGRALFDIMLEDF